MQQKGGTRVPLARESFVLYCWRSTLGVLRGIPRFPLIIKLWGTRVDLFTQLIYLQAGTLRSLL